MVEEKLIEAVRKHRELYDTQHTAYMKVKLKRRIWGDIAKDLNLEDGEEAKTLWLNLRGSYRDARRRQLRSLKSGIPAETIKPWRFQKQMSFLESCMLASSRESNLSDDSDYSLPATTSARNDILETGEENEESEQSQDLNNEDNREVSTRSRGTKYITHYPAISNPDIQRNQSKKRKQDDVILLKQSMQHHEERAPQMADERRALESILITDDPLYNFFISMYQLTKNMPQSYQHRIRGQVFQAVSKAEEELMNLSSQPNSMSFSSNNSASNNALSSSLSPSLAISTDSQEQKPKMRV